MIMAFQLPDILPPVVNELWFSNKKSTEIESEIEALEKEKAAKVS